jgi:cytoskeletal protein RodZ
MSEDFGSYLKHERELRGIALDEIARSTKISTRFLTALEENRFEDLPGEVFVKGFIRAYGQAIGLNADELLAAYHETSGTGPESGAFASSATEAVEEVPESPDNPLLKAGLGIGAALIIVISGIYWVTTGGDSTPEPDRETRSAAPLEVDNSLPEVAQEAESTAPAEAGGPPSEGEPPKSAPADAAEPAHPPATAAATGEPSGTPVGQTPIKNTVTVSEKNDIMKDLQDQTVSQPEDVSTETAMVDQSLRLVIRVSENAWFNLTVDDQRDQDFILPAGGSTTIKAKNVIVMTIGNRRATELMLNNQPLELPESPDNVIRNLTVNAELLN